MEDQNQNQNQPSENDSKNRIEKWDELPIEQNLLRGIYAYGFDEPSEIQKKAI